MRKDEERRNASELEEGRGINGWICGELSSATIAFFFTFTVKRKRIGRLTKEMDAMEGASAKSERKNNAQGTVKGRQPRMSSEPFSHAACNVVSSIGIR